MVIVCSVKTFSVLKVTVCFNNFIIQCTFNLKNQAQFHMIFSDSEMEGCDENFRLWTKTHIPADFNRKFLYECSGDWRTAG